VVDRRNVVVSTPGGGREQPWPNVAEIENVFPSGNWTLVGGLMTQLHSIHPGEFKDAFEAFTRMAAYVPIELEPW
jgi:hypothetical protein